MPRPKCSDEAGQRFLISKAKFAANPVASNSRMKLFDIDSIRIYHDFFGPHTRLNKIVSLDFGDDKDARCHGEIQSLASLQQVSNSLAAPVFRHPNFRPVIFQKQWPARTQAGFDSTPIKSTVALIDKIRRCGFHLRASAIGKEQAVVQVERGASETEWIRLDQLNRYFRIINASQTVIAYYRNLSSQLSRSVDEALRVRRCAAGLCAGCRSSSQVRDSRRDIRIHAQIEFVSLCLRELSFQSTQFATRAPQRYPACPGFLSETKRRAQQHPVSRFFSAGAPRVK